MKAFKLLPLALVAALAACQQNSAPAAGTSADQAAPAAQAAPAVPAEQKDPSGMLTIAPGAIDLCAAPEGAIAMDVSWNATKGNTDGIKVFLTDPETKEEKLWLAAPAQGHDKTGPWMRDGTVVRLVNANTDVELAKLVVTSKACVR